MSRATGILFDIRRYSLHDGPGIRTAVFFKGCPLRCAWCHNPESQRQPPELILRPKFCIACAGCVSACPQNAIHQDGERLWTERLLCQDCGACVEACYAEARQLVGRRWTLDEVLAVLERDAAFYARSGGGVTFTGGEPLAQPGFLAALLAAARRLGLHTAVETSGYARWETVERLRPDVDLFLYDLKLIDERRHRQWTGVSNRRILDNLQRLSQAGAGLVVRIPLVPGANADAENLAATAAFLAGLPNLLRVDVLPYHPSAEAKYAGLGRDYALAGLGTPPADALESAAAALQRFGLPTTIGG